MQYHLTGTDNLIEAIGLGTADVLINTGHPTQRGDLIKADHLTKTDVLIDTGELNDTIKTFVWKTRSKK